MQTGMYELVKDSRDIGDLNSWLAFDDRDQFDPIQDGWITVNRDGHHIEKTDIGKVEQGFRVHSFLVDKDNLDDVLAIDPFGKIPDFDFNPMRYGWRRGEGKYWKEDLSRSVEGVEAKRFVMDFDKEAPLIDPGFIEYFNLIEKEKRNFEAYDTDEKVVKFSNDKWEYLSSQSSHYGLENTIRSLEVKAEYLKDYLKERGVELVLAYYQSRDVKDTNQQVSLPDDDRENFEIRGGKATRAVRRTVPGFELNWFCPVRIQDIPYSREEELTELRQNLKFKTKQGYRFSKEEAINEEGFAEAGFRRPALGADSLEEAISFFGWTYFEPEVLEKYKNDRRGSVEEWSKQGLQVRWLDKMNLRAYRNDEDLILIIIDDLAKIPDEELSHWHHYNTSSAGVIPEEMITNYIEADFVDSESPADAVVNAVTELGEIFQSEYGERLYRETGDEIDSGKMLSLPRNERRELLNVMVDVHQVVIENLDRGSLEARLSEDVIDEVGGKKSALYEFVRSLSDTDRAG
ncbi:MAG: hypothetical protein ABEI86_01705, partial [Halobacteriaceae archaeon]